jgi:hypothetical protein
VSGCTPGCRPGRQTGGLRGQRGGRFFRGGKRSAFRSWWQAIWWDDVCLDGIMDGTLGNEGFVDSYGFVGGF